VVDDHHPSSECPSCGRFVGPYERCPYCGAVVGKRMAVRVFKVGSLVLAIAGLGVLFLIAARSQVPAIELDAVMGTMNWAYVRVEGTVSRPPDYDPEAKSLKLWVWDGSGEIMVMAYRAEADWLLADGRVPVMGDEIAVEGTLRVREDFEYLVLNVPQHTEIRPAEPIEMSIIQVSQAVPYQKVTVRGMIRDDREPYQGLRILTLRDASGEIDVTLPASATLLAGELPMLGLGQAVQVTGAVDHYQGMPQVAVGWGSDVVVLEESLAIAPERAAGNLSAADVGSMAAVEGQITKVSPFSAGVKYTLDDGTGLVTLLLWQNLYDVLAGRDRLVEGALVRVQGEVAEYRGELELVPELPSDVAVLAVAERVVAERQLGELSAGDVGQWVRVEGVLQTLRSFSAGVRGTLDDGTGVVTLLLWQDVYDLLADPAVLAPGAVLRVEGEVAEYKGELEIVPRAAADLVVVGQVELPSVEWAIGQLSADDVGQIVQVAGQVVEVVPFSRGVKYLLDDGSGTITLLLWQNIYDELAAPDALAAGARLVARGKVNEYLGELEIVPQVPADVQVTGGAQVAMVTPTTAPVPEATARPSSTPTPQSTDLPAPSPTPQPTDPPTPAPTSQPTDLPTPPPTPASETRTIGAISGADVGSTFTVAQAGISEADYFSRGVRYTLDDSSGSIVLLIWQNVLEEIPERHALYPGSQVRVTGRIEEYQGELEIVPQRGADVVVLAQGEHPPIEVRTVNGITPSDEGRIFVVEGAVARVEGNGWLRIWLKDGTGEILVFVPERTVEYLPAGIGPGVRLRVTGEVDIYRGQLELIPLAGGDIEVQ
jgi:DNA/RNA endonuclease YhcR with UshA esterase domain